MANRRVGYVEPGSLAEEAGICAGDSLIKINGHEFYDILEYRFLSAEPFLELEVEKQNGDTEIISIETDYEELGIEFEESLIDTAKSCSNKCIFCFIDQLPRGMRDTVYFKDDDTRLSFLQGNYVTLTNISDEELNRLIAMRVSPINISVHTTNPELRVKMLNNRFAGNVYERMKLLAGHEIFMNCQIVLCYDINDGAELKRSLLDMSKLYPYVQSISVVPVGLTAYREGLCSLIPYDKEKSEEVIEYVGALQNGFYCQLGTRLVYLSDEFYVMAGRRIPDAEEYEGFPQIENGVGLIASMEEEFSDGECRIAPGQYNRTVSIATGEAAYGFIKSLAVRLEKRAEGLKINVYPIKNEFFGGYVTVSGLVCGGDIIKQLKNRELGECLYIPEVMLRDDELFLDDTTVDDLRRELGTEVCGIMNDGYDFIEKLLDTTLEF